MSTSFTILRVGRSSIMFKLTLFLNSVLSLVLVGVSLPVDARDTYTRQPEIDIQHYRFQLQVSDQSDQIHGQAQVCLNVLQTITSFHLDLGSPAADGKGMQVSAVKLNQRALSFSHINDVLTLQLGESVAAGTSLCVDIDYQGEPRSGLHISKNKFGDRVFFADNWPDQGRQWLPVIDHPADKATVEFVVTAPEQYAVVANGLKVEESSLDGHQKLTHWREDVPLAVKVMVIGVARFAVQESAKNGDIAVSSWVFPQNREEGFKDYALALQPLTFFQKKIAAYPYKKLANVQSKTRFGGLENANTIFYFENSVTGKGDSEALIAHEIAHQWFGNSATENDWHHVWLSEGFATYFTQLYIEDKFGREEFVKKLLASREKVIRYFQKVQRPIVDTQIQDPKNVLSPNTYEKAGWVLHMLRQELGDEKFWQGIRLYYTRFAGKNAMSQDVQAAMQDVSGKKLDRFFQQWLYQPGHPQLTMRWQYENERVRIELIQSQTDLFDFPIDIAVMDKSGQMHVHTTRVHQRQQQIFLPVDTKPASLHLDPLVRLLFEAKVENK